MSGRVKISWTFEVNDAGSRQLRLTWVEEGGPPVVAQTKKGFGHVVLERIIAASLGGVVAVDFAVQGIRWTLTIPAENLAGGGDSGVGGLALV